MADDGSIHIGTKIDSGDLKSQLGDMKKSIADSFSSIRDIMQGPIAAFNTVKGAIQGISNSLGAMEKEAADSAKSIALLESTIKATGAETWTSSAALEDMINSLKEMTGVDDDVIRSMETVLLGFKNIKGDNFKEASLQIMNMATVMHMDLTSAAQAVGKALDDPIAGIDSLTRQGFRFSAQQKAMLKDMVNTGHTAEAQKIILDELATTYGGAAEAAGQTAASISNKLSLAVGDLRKEVGKTISEAMTPLRETMLGILSPIVEWAKQGDNLKNVLKIIIPILAGVAAGIIAIGIAAISATGAFKAMAAALSGATGGLSVVFAAIATAIVALFELKNSVGGWEAVWVQFKLWGLQAFDGIVTGINWVANKITIALNFIIDKINWALRLLGKKEMGKISGDLINADGLKKDIADLEKQLDSLKKKKKEVADIPDPIAPSEAGLSNAENDALKTKEAYEKQWDEKLLDLQNDTLEKQLAAELAYAESIGANTAKIREYYAIEIAKRNIEIEKQNARDVLEAKKAASEEQIKLDEAADKKNPWKVSGIVGTRPETVNQQTGDMQIGATTGGTEVGNLATGLSSVMDILSGGITSIVSQVASLANVAKLLNPLQTIINAMMDVLGPVINDLLDPLVGILETVGKTIGSILAPALKILEPIIEVISAMFMFLYNKVIVPVANFMIIAFNKIHNGFAAFINGILNMIDAIPFVSISYRVGTVSDTEGTLSEISSTSSASSDLADNLADANAELKENRELFTKSSKAADAYNAVLTGVVKTVSGFYDGLKDIGSDLASTIIDSITSGFDNDDFLYALEEYIRNAVIRAAVFTDSFTSSLASIGTQLAQAIASGDTSSIESLKNQLAALYATASATAEAATEAVSGAFGSYAVGSLGLPSDGLIYAHQGEAVIPAGLMSEALTKGLTIAPTASLMSGTGNVTVNLNAALSVDGKAMAGVVFQYQDDLVGAAYGA